MNKAHGDKCNREAGVGEVVKVLFICHVRRRLPTVKFLLIKNSFLLQRNRHKVICRGVRCELRQSNHDLTIGVRDDEDVH